MTSDRASSRAAMRATIQKKSQLDLGVEMPGGERGLFRLAHCGNSMCAVSNYWRAGNGGSKDNPRFRWGGSASNNAFRKPSTQTLDLAPTSLLARYGSGSKC